MYIVVEFFGISILKNVGPTKAMIWGCEICFCSNLAEEKFGFPTIWVYSGLLFIILA